MSHQYRLQTLGKFIYDLTIDDLPKNLVQQMRNHTYNTLAVGFAGAQTDKATTFRSTQSHGQLSPQFSSPIWGTSNFAEGRVSAMLNGFAAHVLELDDTGGCDHSGAVMIPALAAAIVRSPQGTTLGDVILAATVGYEVARRTQYFLGGYGQLNNQGWHSTAVCGPLGAAAAVAKLYRLSAEGIMDSMGLASSRSGGTWSFKSGGGLNKTLHTGMAAADGFESASLAAHGVPGTRDVFEDVWGGFGQVFSDDDANSGIDWNAMTADLGTRWVASEATIKPFATCASTHPSVRIALYLFNTFPHNNPIERVTVSVSRIARAMCGENRLTKLEQYEERQLSIPFAIAAALTVGEVTLESVLAPLDPDTNLAKLLGRINVVTAPDRDDAAGNATMTVEFHNGDVIVVSSEDLPDTGNQMSHTEVKNHSQRTLEAFSLQHMHQSLLGVIDGALDAPARQVFPA